MGDHQRVKFEKHDGKIVCDKTVFQQFIIRHFNLSVNDLSIGCSYNNQFLIADQNGNISRKSFVTDGIPIFDHVFNKNESTVRPFINGRARLAGDKLSVIGEPENTVSEVDLTFEEFSEVSEDFDRFAWKTKIFFFPANWEASSEDHWSISIYVPSQFFRTLAAEIATNRQLDINISIETDLWTDESHGHVPGAGSVIWYLEPNKSGKLDRMPETATGNVTSIGFTNKTPRVAETSEQSSRAGAGFTNSYAGNLVAIYGALRLIGVAIFILAAVIIFKR